MYVCILPISTPRSRSDAISIIMCLKSPRFVVKLRLKYTV